jgi:hypothetical protein
MGNEVAPAASTPERRCSRCRQLFPVDAEDRPYGPTEWWLCQPCHAKLIGDRAGRTGS